MALARKAFARPALLSQADLDPLRGIVHDDALDYTLVLGSFHFINRIADLLHVPLEGVPRPLRGFELLRRLTVRLASIIMGRMDLSNRAYAISYEEALKNLTPLFNRTMGRDPEEDFAPLRSRPKIIEAFQLALEERETLSSLDGGVHARIHRAVEAALPKNMEEAEGFHDRPDDPMEAFAFVGTRYAYRTTRDMIDALRGDGYDDLAILDLAMAVAEANQWARTHRLLGLRPELFYVG
ncbi:MAG: hypothetical protein GY849_08455 [Deltaproteobacteria bacterium]|nr:hypothetical protein [Deltaproteobacteria bacterium]